jgi:hypothetical protein
MARAAAVYLHAKLSAIEDEEEEDAEHADAQSADRARGDS